MSLAAHSEQTASSQRGCRCLLLWRRCHCKFSTSMADWRHITQEHLPRMPLTHLTFQRERGPCLSSYIHRFHFLAVLILKRFISDFVSQPFPHQVKRLSLFSARRFQADAGYEICVGVTVSSAQCGKSHLFLFDWYCCCLFPLD